MSNLKLVKIIYSFQKEIVMKRHNFKELKVWQRSKTLAIEIYKATNGFPKQEMFGLTQQIRKSAVSVPSNIAEGCGRGTDRELIRFLDIAQGSAFELETQLIIAADLGFLNESSSDRLAGELSEIQRMIEGFRDKFS
jgi:four helix bundle protein